MLQPSFLVIPGLGAHTGETLATHRCSSAISSLAWSPNGKQIATGGEYKTLEVWRPRHR